jgi:hypothetical protein
MTSVNKALAEIAMASGKNDITDNEVANCTNRITNCYKLLDKVKNEQDLNIKRVMLAELFKKINACAYCQSFSSLMSNEMSSLMKAFNDAVVVHNKNVDYARLAENGEQSAGGTRRRNKKSKNYKKKSKKSRKTKSRRH